MPAAEPAKKGRVLPDRRLKLERWFPVEPGPFCFGRSEPKLPRQSSARQPQRSAPVRSYGAACLECGYAPCYRGGAGGNLCRQPRESILSSALFFDRRPPSLVDWGWLEGRGADGRQAIATNSPFATGCGKGGAHYHSACCAWTGLGFGR
jgi:hypothetical protein